MMSSGLIDSLWPGIAYQVVKTKKVRTKKVGKLQSGGIMELSIEKLKQVLGEAFDLGYQSCNEFKNELIGELLVKMQTVKVEEAYRIYKCDELRNMPEGTLFQHSSRGRCWVIVRQDGSKAIQFQKGGVAIGLIKDNEPWDRPMKLMHSECLSNF